MLWHLGERQHSVCLCLIVGVKNKATKMHSTSTNRYIIDKESASKVNTNVQDGLFLMAVSNSCLNPLIYSTYSMRRCRFPWSRKRCGGEVAGGGAKTELQRRSTGNTSKCTELCNDCKHIQPTIHMLISKQFCIFTSHSSSLMVDYVKIRLS